MKKSLLAILLSITATASFSTLAVVATTPYNGKVLSFSEFKEMQPKESMDRAIWKTVSIDVKKFGTAYEVTDGGTYFRCANPNGKITSGDFYAQIDRYEAPTEDADAFYVVGNCI